MPIADARRDAGGNDFTQPSHRELDTDTRQRSGCLQFLSAVAAARVAFEEAEAALGDGNRDAFGRAMEASSEHLRPR